jgi:hypothetical protein
MNHATKMKSEPTVHKFLIAGFSMTVIGATVAHAQPDFLLMPPPKGGVETNRPPLIQTMLNTSFTAEGKTKYQGAKQGNSGAFNVDLGANGMFPLNEDWMLPLDLMSQNYWLESVPGTPVPIHINTLGFGAGLGCRAVENWMFIARISPLFYRLYDVNSDDVGVAGGLMAMWNYSPTFQFMFGIMVAPDSDLPVLPMAGMNWRINEQWDLSLMFPQPRLTFQPNEHWRFYAGVNINGTTFRTSNALGNDIGNARYNNALGTYRDVRFGGGIGYTLNQNVRVEAEAGYSISRQIDYTDLDTTVKFDPAPYVRIGINVGF